MLTYCIAIVKSTIKFYPSEIALTKIQIFSIFCSFPLISFFWPRGSSPQWYFGLHFTSRSSSIWDSSAVPQLSLRVLVSYCKECPLGMDLFWSCLIIRLSSVISDKNATRINTLLSYQRIHDLIHPWDVWLNTHC